MRDRHPVALGGLDDRLIRPADDRLAVQLEFDREDCQLLIGHAVHYATSWGKYFMTLRTGFGAACPNPQIDASIITCESSFSNGWSQFELAISVNAFAVPTRQGVH